jgi:ketosteroid isomerase-like protein
VSEDVLSVVRANSAAFSDRDVETMLTYYAPDAVVVDQRPHGLGSFSGHDELRNYYLSIFHSVDAMREHLEVLAHRDGTVVAHCELWARLPSDTSGAGVTAPYGLLMRIEGGRIARLDVYTDGQEALAASGLDR